MPKYAIGIDYGTLSVRAVLVCVKNGREMARSEFYYPHGVMERELPCGRRLGPDWALQHPSDYLAGLYHTVPALLTQSGVKPEDVIGIGVDFTSCTMLPVKQDGRPLCLMEEFCDHPHAYVKLWKHHAAQDKANRMNETAKRRGESWLDSFGGKISAEGAHPKLWQLLCEAPEIYRAMDHWLEAGDWLVWQLTGRLTRNSCAAGYKALYDKRRGYPSPAFFAELDGRLAQVTEEKFKGPVLPIGQKAGGLTQEMADSLGLMPGIAIAAGIVDGHVSMAAAGITQTGRMLSIMGTSNALLLLSQEEVQVPGICGRAEDGIIPGFIGYEAGQCCLGDHFDWLVRHCVSADEIQKAKEQGISVHDYLSRLAANLAPGQSGLLALDFWNGNRSILIDADLTGLMLGMSLQTTAFHMYRALIESTAYGVRLIIENYRAHGIAVEEFLACGGISQKNPLVMQIFADVLKMPVQVLSPRQDSALGSAVFAALAAGGEQGGYDDIREAAQAMTDDAQVIYEPREDESGVYDQLFMAYRRLHDYFGRGENDVMKRLKAIKTQNSPSQLTALM